MGRRERGKKVKVSRHCSLQFANTHCQPRFHAENMGGGKKGKRKEIWGRNRLAGSIFSSRKRKGGREIRREKKGGQGAISQLYSPVLLPARRHKEGGWKNTRKRKRGIIVACFKVSARDP